MERHTLFVQTNRDLFQDGTLCPFLTSSYVATDSVSTLTRQDALTGDSLICDAHIDARSRVSLIPKVLSPSDIHIRRERQTFIRLHETKAILFTVRTYMQPLTSLGDEELAAFVEIVGQWSDELAAYKGRDKWWDTVLQYQETRETGLSQEK